MPPFPSVVIEPNQTHDISRPLPTVLPLSSYFILLPVRSCENSAAVVLYRSIQSTIQNCCVLGSNLERKAVYRHSNPFGNLYGMMFCQSEQDRFELTIQFVEFLCILDDVTEDMSQDQALLAHRYLCEILDFTSSNETAQQSQHQMMKKFCVFLTSMRDKLTSFDSESGLQLVSALSKTIGDRESGPNSFATLEEYIPIRLMNLDHRFICQLLLWSMKINPLDLGFNMDAVIQFQHNAGVIAGFTNDYFSWNMEKQQYTNSDRIRNAIPVLMKEHSVGETEARRLLKDRITEEVGQQNNLRRQIEEELHVSEDIVRYINGLDCLVGGYSYWCFTCPRYHSLSVDTVVDTLDQRL
ncbi:terpenoid synthase [Dendrothele bispora CBS 962.96]|uniref:Terpenoid synthase n=1 Tax=Dendrothele bispora (strain CBS 962.96) TaxID=1314807 RepID=A0A4V4HAM1_DENBC|nr:terpenoid synthase [Dendrothele bispora CBS 962.96]